MSMQNEDTQHRPRWTAIIKDVDGVPLAGVFAIDGSFYLTDDLEIMATSTVIDVDGRCVAHESRQSAMQALDIIAKQYNGW